LFENQDRILKILRLANLHYSTAKPTNKPSPTLSFIVLASHYLYQYIYCFKRKYKCKYNCKVVRPTLWRLGH
jgi:hypothetical protein